MKQPELNFPFIVICTNDKNRPVEIPPEKWVTEGKPYTATGVLPCGRNQTGFVLEEIILDESNFPYECINVERFGLPAEDKQASEAVEELIGETLTEPELV